MDKTCASQLGRDELIVLEKLNQTCVIQGETQHVLKLPNRAASVSVHKV